MGYYREPADTTTPEDIFLREEDKDQDRMRAVVETLPRPYRVLLLSLHYERTSTAEVARRLGVGRTSVYRLIERAAEEVRHRWTENYDTAKLDWQFHALMQSAKYRVEDGRVPTVALRGIAVPLPLEFDWTSTTSARARGPVEVLRVLDQSLFHRDAPPVTFARPMLLREFCESRLLRPVQGMTPFEESIARRLR